MKAWLAAELHGYSDTDEVPEYRRLPNPPITLIFNGFGGSQDAIRIAASDLPKEIATALSDFSLRQPAAELAVLATAEATPSTNLPPRWVHAYRQRIQERADVPHIPMMILNEARVTLPPSFLAGVVDQIRSHALSLALGLEDVSQEAGSLGGPTVEQSAELAHQVQVHLTNFGSNLTVNAAIATAPHASVSQSVAIGDVGAVLSAAESILQADGVVDLREALEADQGVPQERTSRFLARVRDGGYRLVGDLTGSAAYDAMKALLAQAFPDVMG